MRYKINFDTWCQARRHDGRWERIYPPKWFSPVSTIVYRLLGYRHRIWWTPIVKRVGD